MELIRIDAKDEDNVRFECDDDDDEVEVVLGRGPVLKIADSSVSREMAKITRKNKPRGFYFSPVSQKKTVFHRRKKDQDFAAVEIGEEIQLRDEDKIGILKDKFHYEVRFLNRGEKSVVSNPKPISDRSLPDWMLKCPKSSAALVNNKEVKQIKKPKALKRGNSNLSDDKKPSPFKIKNDEKPKNSTPIKKWPKQESPLKKSKIHDISDDDDEDDQSPRKSSPIKRLMQKSPAKSSPLKRNTHDISDDDDESPRKSSPMKAKTQKSPGKSPCKRRIHDISDDDDDDESPKKSKDHDISSDDEDHEVKKSAKKSPFKKKTVHDLSDSEDILNAAGSSSGQKRSKCQFGGKCYRKNPQHKADFSHPGDSDFEEQSDADDDKPECEYGTDCYRKNPQHRKDFKHTKKVGNKKKGKKELNEDEELLNDSYESSFIDDDDDSQPMDDLTDEESEALLNSSNIIQDSEDIIDDDDDRPECEFGTDCYRKNPQHKRDYKHTKRPKRRVVRNMMRNNEDDSDDDDEFEDSQLADISNDEESVDEWNPDEDD